jgi:hypothetical protein
MRDETKKTTLYLDPDLLRRAKHRRLDAGITSDSEMVEEALRCWIVGLGYIPDAIPRPDRFQTMTAEIMDSEDFDTISALQQNIESFYRLIGKDPKIVSNPEPRIKKKAV